MFVDTKTLDVIHKRAGWRGRGFHSTQTHSSGGSSIRTPTSIATITSRKKCGVVQPGRALVVDYPVREGFEN
jgi:hypothetical protein